MRREIQYKSDAKPASQQSEDAKPKLTKAKKRRKSQTQRILEAAARNKEERKQGKKPTIEIYC